MTPGDLVVVGPGYRMGGTYEPDGAEGPYTLLELRPTGDVLLARGHLTLSEYLDALDTLDWDLSVAAGRCTVVGVVPDDRLG